MLCLLVLRVHGGDARTRGGLDRARAGVVLARVRRGGGGGTSCLPSARVSPPTHSWPCDSGIVSYFGPQNFSGPSAAATLQRQLYLCMVAQALEMKGNIETRRSGNAWGTIVWQLNEM